MTNSIATATPTYATLRLSGFPISRFPFPVTAPPPRPLGAAHGIPVSSLNVFPLSRRNVYVGAARLRARTGIPHTHGINHERDSGGGGCGLSFSGGPRPARDGTRIK